MGLADGRQPRRNFTARQPLLKAQASEVLGPGVHQDDAGNLLGKQGGKDLHVLATQRMAHKDEWRFRAYGPQACCEPACGVLAADRAGCIRQVQHRQKFGAGGEVERGPQAIAWIQTPTVARAIVGEQARLHFFEAADHLRPDVQIMAQARFEDHGGRSRSRQRVGERLIVDPDQLSGLARTAR
jgi:hypothetical protein